LSEKKISFVLPTFNEVGNIERLIKEIDRCIQGFAKEFIVVDDNSTDGTWQLVKKMEKQDQRVRLILRTANRGLTPSLQEGIEAAGGNLVSWMDCDLSMPPAKIPEMIQKIENGYDCVIGSRFVAGGGVVFIADGPDSLAGIILSMMLNKFIMMVLGKNIRDYTSGFIVIKRHILNKYRLRGDYGEYFIDLMYRLNSDGYRIREIPYIFQAREKGVSKTGSNLGMYLSRGWRYVVTVIRLKLIF